MNEFELQDAQVARYKLNPILLHDSMPLNFIDQTNPIQN